MQNKKILIIDDDQTSLDILDYLLTEKSFSVFRDSNGSEALDKLEEVSPDLAIIDLMMPNLTGIEVIKLIRERNFNFPIIAFTASNEEDIHSQAISSGANLLVTKPCSPKILLSHINSLIKDFNSE